jgi:hypothetical protein
VDRSEQPYEQHEGRPADEQPYPADDLATVGDPVGDDPDEDLIDAFVAAGEDDPEPDGATDPDD